MDTDVEMVEKPIVANGDNHSSSGASFDDEEVVTASSTAASFKSNILNKSRSNSTKSNASVKSNGGKVVAEPIVAAESKPEDEAKLVEEAEKSKNQGNASYKEGNYREAIEYYNKAIELCPKNAAYYGNRAAAYLMINKHKETIADAQMSTRLDPNFVKGFLREGKAHLFLGDYQSALRCFEKVKEIEPTNSSVAIDIQNSNAVKHFSEQAQDSFAKSEFRKVVFLMDRILQHSTHSTHFQVLKAECLALLGRYQ